MDNSVYTSFEQMKGKASNLRDKANAMQFLLEEVSKIMNTTVGEGRSWNSNAAENTKAKYTTLANKFKDFYGQLNTYAKFIDETAASYQGADTKVSQAAEELL